jgi:eukaryotic-like serine/threonine-protein kinase
MYLMIPISVIISLIIILLYTSFYSMLLQFSKAIAISYDQNYNIDHNNKNYNVYNSNEFFKNKSNLHNYQNLKHGLKIQYPANWTLSEENGNTSDIGQQQKLLKLKDDGNIVTFYSPLENNNGSHPANFRIFSRDLPLEVIGSSSYPTNSYLLDRYSFSFLHALMHSNSTIMEPFVKVTFGIDKNIGYVIQYGLGNTQQSVLEALTINNNKIYDLRYTNELKDYSKYLPVVKSMINSLDIETD